MAQGNSMALAETLRRPHILRYLSLSLPTNFTAVERETVQRNK